MDVSELREKPAGRQPIDTRAVASSRINEVMEAVGRALDKGKLVYWIVPLVEEYPLLNNQRERVFHLATSKRRGRRLSAANDHPSCYPSGQSRTTGCRRREDVRLARWAPLSLRRPQTRLCQCHPVAYIKGRGWKFDAATPKIVLNGGTAPWTERALRVLGCRERKALRLD
jgi:hypothetical protein